MTVDKPPSFLFSVRFIITIMAFFGYCLQYMLKINMGIAIVCMVNNTALKELSNHGKDPIELLINTTIDDSKCKVNTQHSNDLNGNFIWDKSLQGFILASYFYGYIITQIPGGWLSSKYGGKNVLGLSMFLASVFTMLTPVTARWGYIPLSICRFIIGLAHGAFWPAQSSIFVFWAPAKERTKMVGTSTSGAWIGNIIALPLGAYLCVLGFDGGWPSIFYIFGIIGCVWSGLFMFLVSDSPMSHRFISETEKSYLVFETQREASGRQKKMKTPWKRIFTSKVCWATFIAHFCNNWGNYLYLTQLPSFMKDVLKFDIKSNGLMSAIPYVACALSTAVLAIVSDILITKKILSRRNVRRVFNGIGQVIPGIAVICLSFVDCSLAYLGVGCLAIGLAFNGFYWAAGPLVNINDIGGSFSGVIFGITNTFGTIPGIVCPFIVGFITKNRTQEEWQIVFVICACVYFFGALVYWLFCDSEIRPWAVKNDNENVDLDDRF